MRFTSLALLKAQIEKDVAQTKKIFADLKNV
jgi:FAD synthase